MRVVFGVMALYVLVTRDWTLLDSHCVPRQSYAPIPWLWHGIPGALILGVFQFSTWWRQRFLKLHRIPGRVYVGIGSAMVTAIASGHASHVIDGVDHWLGGHRGHNGLPRPDSEDSVFVVVRVIGAIPAIERMGLIGVAMVVWTVIAVACFLPSFVIPDARIRQIGAMCVCD